MNLLRTANLTFWIGALLFGGVISLLHLKLNRLTSVREAFAVLCFCMALYGVASAAAGTVGAVATAATRRLLGSQNRAGAGEPAGLLPALLCFQLPFWLTASPSSCRRPE